MTISPTTRHRTARHSLWLLMLASLAAQSVHAQNDWPAWGRDSGNQRHSPLTQNFSFFGLLLVCSSATGRSWTAVLWAMTVHSCGFGL